MRAGGVSERFYAFWEDERLFFRLNRDSLDPCIFLDGGEIISSEFADKGDCFSLFAGAPGASDAVDVILRLFGEIVIDDMRDAVNMDAAGGDVGGDDNFALDRKSVV